MAIVSSGQLTLVDLNDSKQLQLYINASQPKTQIYNPNGATYTPNWTTSKPVLTPQLFVAGTSSDIIANAKSITWSVDGAELTASTTDYTLGTTGAKALTINKNILTSANTKLFVCEVVYVDPDTSFEVTAKADIEFVKVSAGSDGAAGTNGTNGTNGATGAAGADALRAVVWTPDGNVIKNSVGTLTAKCDFYKGASVLTSGVTYQWYVQDASQTTDAGGGIGWKKLTSSYALSTTGYATQSLTIPAAAITSVTSFKCVATYASKTYQDVCTVSDVTDPIQVNVVGASIFKNGEGSTTLTAKLFQAGVEIDSTGNQGYTYSWSLYDASSTKIAGFSKTGKTITVSATDVEGRANIICDVSK